MFIIDINYTEICFYCFITLLIIETFFFRCADWF